MDSTKLSLAAEAYLYGYPLVEGVREMIKNTSGPATVFSGPINTFAHAAALAGPETDIVSPNNDTLYSFVFADVKQEPLVLHLPDTNGRYYVMQFIDAWTNNFAYLGRRATGTSEALYLLAGPDWDGDVPDGVKLLRAPTSIFVIAGRFACSGEADIPTVQALQQETWVTPLSLYPEQPALQNRHFGDWEYAPFDEGVGGDLKFWEQLRAWMKLFPPPDAERGYVQKFEPLGLLANTSPYVDPDPQLAKVLQAGKAERVAFIEANSAAGEPINGWRYAAHAFDFNLDNLRIGALPDWKFADRGTAYFFRAVIARIGLWGQHGHEALYPQTFDGSEGRRLHGSNRYVIHFEDLPPVDAFWSITMYDVPRYRLIPNSIKRYSIGDRTAGLQYNQDGSLDIYLQYDSPGPEKEPNWLPCPAGNFRPIMRMYQPRQEALDGSYVLPPIVRVT